MGVTLEAVSQQPSAATLHAELQNPSTLYLLTRANKMAVAFAKLVLGVWHDGSVDPSAAHFERNYVLSQFQGQGIGSRLFAARLEYAKKNGCTRGWLSVWQENKSAIAFHRRNGFEVQGECTFTMKRADGSEYVDHDYIMVRTL